MHSPSSPAYFRPRIGQSALDQMAFLESYLRLPRWQRVLLGVAGVVVGWYGPSLMTRLSQLYLSEADEGCDRKHLKQRRRSG